MRRVVRVVLVVALVLAAAAPIVALRALGGRADAAAAEAERRDSRSAPTPPGPTSAAPTPAAPTPPGPDSVGAGTDGAAPTSAAPLLAARRLPEELLEPQADAALAGRVAAVIADQPELSCLVVDVDDRSVVAHQPAIPLVPASVGKLATARAVLDHIRPEERFATRLVTEAEVTPEGVVAGDVWIVGGGDPVLATADYAGSHDRQPQLRTPFEDLSALLAEQGIRAVDGRILGADDRYDQLRTVPSWPSRYASDGNAGPLSALSLDDGFVLSGDTYERSSDPPRAAAERLTEDLLAAGIAVADQDARSGPEPPDATVLVELVSPPVSEIVGQMLRESDNNTAELLLKEIGLRILGTGSTEAGASVAQQSLAGRGLDPAQFVIVDGSGLDRGNMLSCGVAESLTEGATPGTVVGDGLAVAARTGTLSGRFAGSGLEGVLGAKTGSLDGVRALAGVVPTAVGTISFAQIVNDLPGGSPLGAELQDRLVAALASYPEGPDPADVAP